MTFILYIILVLESSLYNFHLYNVVHSTLQAGKPFGKCIIYYRLDSLSSKYSICNRVHRQGGSPRGWRCEPTSYWPTQEYNYKDGYKDFRWSCCQVRCRNNFHTQELNSDLTYQYRVPNVDPLLSAYKGSYKLIVLIGIVLTYVVSIG